MKVENKYFTKVENKIFSQIATYAWLGVKVPFFRFIGCYKNIDDKYYIHEKNVQRLFKKGEKYLWDILVFIAYFKFYIICFIGTILSLVCSMWILAQAGHDITAQAKGLKWIAYSGLTFILIIMFDKLFGEKRNG